MWLLVCKAYPIAHLNIIDFEMPSFHYIKNARNGHATNLYYPEANSDKFEWNENDFIYQGYRDEINGTNPPEGETVFRKLFNKYKKRLERLATESKEYMDELGGRN
jgi:thymidylate synthase (FAD)